MIIWYIVVMARKPMRNFPKILLLSVGCAAANVALGYLSIAARTGLFLDSAFIITAAFSGGIGAGLLASLFTSLGGGIYYYFFYGRLAFWGVHLYVLCFAATALVTWLFSRSFPDACMPLRLNRLPDAPPGPKNENLTVLDLIIMLSLLALALLIIISVMGALISVFNSMVLQSVTLEESTETTFKTGLLLWGFSPTLTEILARIPINIIDRPVSVLIGYGTSLLLKKIAPASGIHS
ncbi:hypothetical protein FACS1894140_1420 [Spirochaetia bacterium]|nr:hypothetical protein FACS1894140_1420 [Spirochaetia bacterium]